MGNIAHVFPGLFTLSQLSHMDPRLFALFDSMAKEVEANKLKALTTAIRIAVGADKGQYEDFIHSLDPIWVRKDRRKATWEVLHDIKKG